jgi:hypothetical protein
MSQKKWALKVFFLGLLSTTFAADALDITGTYQCTGNDPTFTPSAYTQKMIINHQGEAYPIVEEDSAGTVTPYKQFGVLTGNILSIAWLSTKPNTNDFGVQVYKVSKNGKTLTGPFIYWDKFNMVGTETCQKVK